MLFWCVYLQMLFAVCECIAIHRIFFTLFKLYDSLLFPQTNRLGRLCPLSDRDGHLHLHPQPGLPVGGVCHSWNFRVGNH